MTTPIKAPQRPILVAAPENYDRRHMDQLTRQISTLLGVLQQPAVAKAGGQYYDINSLPTNGKGQRPGMVYRDVEFLKIVLPNVAYAPSLGLTLSLGSVAVTT